MRIAVLAGGRTPEREVSLRSGHRVAQALASLDHDSWVVDPVDGPLAAALGADPPDLCWLTLHGKEGEDGTIQRLLDLLAIPHIGAAAFDCEVAFDKVLAKDALARAQIPTPAWAVVEGAALRDLGAGVALPRALERVGLPCVVKPSRSGSALGVGFVEREEGLAAAVMGALSFSAAAVIETWVSGTEVACALFGEPLETLPPVEIRPRSGTYDYAARYTAGATEYFAPARLPDAALEEVRLTASAAASALAVRDLTRIDIIVPHDGGPTVLEANVSPGMTETSLVPMAAQAAGMTLADLCDRIIGDASARATARPPAR